MVRVRGVARCRRRAPREEEARRRGLTPGPVKGGTQGRAEASDRASTASALAPPREDPTQPDSIPFRSCSAMSSVAAHPCLRPVGGGSIWFISLRSPGQPRPCGGRITDTSGGRTSQAISKRSALLTSLFAIVSSLSVCVCYFVVDGPGKKKEEGGVEGGAARASQRAAGRERMRGGDSARVLPVGRVG